MEYKMFKFNTHKTLGVVKATDIFHVLLWMGFNLPDEEFKQVKQISKLEYEKLIKDRQSIVDYKCDE